jgi:hypothetical protein
MRRVKLIKPRSSRVADRHVWSRSWPACRAVEIGRTRLTDRLERALTGERLTSARSTSMMISPIGSMRGYVDVGAGAAP